MEVIEAIIEIAAEAVGGVVWEAFTGGSSKDKNDKAIKKAAKIGAESIREGRLVAFPTETVYGLGADAFNSVAVARIYEAKGRPGDNPLIVHVASPKGFMELAHNPPDYAMDLIKYHWPGPLTLVAKKKPELPYWFGGHPDRVTDTVGIRMPAHPLAQALIEAAGCPIAAPSANKAGKPSPTSAAHVLEDFPEAEIEGSGITLLDGGEVSVGVESTVIDVTGDYPRLLRPGSITLERIQRDFGVRAEGFKVFGAGEINRADTEKTPPRSPGMKYKHYAPRAPMTVFCGSRADISRRIVQECEKTENLSLPVGLLISRETVDFIPSDIKGGVSRLKILLSGSDDAAIAKKLYANLRRFDKLGVGVIFAEGVDESGVGVAIMDRMKKASEGRVIYV